jgi:hypothetical protein
MKSFAALFLFLGVAHASPAGDVTRALHRYNAEEEQMASAGQMLPAPRLLAHWKELDAVAKQLRQVDAHKLGEEQRVSLRHELSQVLSQPVEVAEVKGDYVDEKVKTADEARRIALVRIARWANGHLDFDVSVVLGVRVDDGDVAGAAGASM